MFYPFLVLLSGVELRTFAFISAQQNSVQPKLMQNLEVGLMYSEHIWLTLSQQTGGTASLSSEVRGWSFSNSVCQCK